MIVHELVQTEAHPVYQRLQIENLDRQYSFLESIVAASVEMQRPLLSSHVIKAFNYHAITCLHVSPGKYRPCEVMITNATHQPPAQYRVQALMDDLVNQVNYAWGNADPVYLASYVLWRLNWIHPFINGNGRTARITAYYLLCLHTGGMVPGIVTLPQLITQNRPEYEASLRAADVSLTNSAQLDLSMMHSFLSRLLNEQVQSAGPTPANPAANTPPTSG